MNATRTSRTGLLLGLAAYTLWGVLPLYFKVVAAVAPFDIVAHRVLWSLPFLALLIALSSSWAKGEFRIARRTPFGSSCSSAKKAWFRPRLELSSASV